MTKHIYFAAFVVDDEDYGCATDTDEIVQYLSNVTTGEGLSNFMVWDNAESLIADHVERGPLTVAYLEGEDQHATDAAPSAPQTPAPVVGPHHGPQMSEQIRLARALIGTDDRRGIVEALATMDRVAHVSALMLAALRLAAERIEMNNYGGEEDEALAEINAAIRAAEGREG